MAESLGMYYYGVGIDLSQMTAGISKAISTIETGSKQMQAALQSVVTSMEQNAGGISGAMNGAASAAKGAADKIQNDLDKIHRKAKQTSEDMYNAFKSTGDRMVMIGAAGGVGLGIMAKKFGDFESLMGRVGGKSGATAQELNALKAQVMDLGKKTEFTTTQVGEGEEALAQLGFVPLQIWQAMPGVLDAAAASGEQVGLVADTMAAQLNSFNMEASESGHVADVLSMAANRSAADFESLSYALKYAGPVANAVGISFEETTAAIMEMSNAGIRGEVAGSTLRAGILRLVDPPKEARKVMEKLGFSAIDSSGKLKPLAVIVEELRGKLQGYTKAQQAQALSMMFGIHSVSGMTVLLQQGGKQMDDYTNSLKNCDGAAKETAEKIRDNLGGDLTKLKGSAETATVTFMQQLEPALRAITKGVTDLINAYIDLPEPIKKVISWTGLYVVGGTLLGGTVLTLIGRFGLLGTAVGNYGKVLKWIITPIGKAIVAFAGLIGKLLATGAAWLVGLGPVGWVIAAIAAVGAVIAAFVYMWNNNIAGFRDNTKKALTDIYNSWLRFLKGLAGVGTGIAKIFLGVAELGINPKKGWETIKAGAAEAVKGYKNMVGGVVDETKAKFELLGGLGKTATTALMKAVSEASKVVKNPFTTKSPKTKDKPDPDTDGGGGGDDDPFGTGGKDEGDKETEYEKRKREYEADIADQELTAAEKLAIYKHYLKGRATTAKEESDYEKGLGRLMLDAEKEATAMRKAEFEKSLVDEKLTEEQKYQMKIDFLKQEIARTKDGTTEKVNLEKELAQTEIDLRRYSLDKQKAMFDKELADEKLSKEEVFQRKIELLQKEVEMTVAGSIDRINAEKAVIEAQREYTAWKQQINETILERQKEHTGAMLDLEMQYLDQEHALGVMDEQYYIQQKMAIEQRKYEIERKALEDKAQLNVQDRQKYEEYLNQIGALDDQYQRERQADLYQMARTNASVWTGLVDNVKGLFQQGLDAMRNGTLTWANSMNAIADNVLNYFVNMGAEWVANWLKRLLVHRAATAANNAVEMVQVVSTETAKQGMYMTTAGVQTAASSAGAAAAVAGATVAATAGITASAAAATGTLSFTQAIGQAISSIPITGWIMGGMILAGVIAAMSSIGSAQSSAQSAVSNVSLPSFDVGSWDVPYDMVANIHKGEVIVPAGFANQARALMTGEGGGNYNISVGYTVQALDSKSVKDMLHEHGNVIGDVVMSRVRAGQLNKTKW